MLGERQLHPHFHVDATIVSSLQYYDSLSAGFPASDLEPCSLAPHSTRESPYGMSWHMSFPCSKPCSGSHFRAKPKPSQHPCHEPCGSLQSATNPELSHRSPRAHSAPAKPATLPIHTYTRTTAMSEDLCIGGLSTWNVLPPEICLVNCTVHISY